jgi:hypothetical protein
MIAAKAEARIEEHKLALSNLIYLYEILERQERRNEMLNSLALRDGDWVDMMSSSAG